MRKKKELLTMMKFSRMMTTNENKKNDQNAKGSNRGKITFVFT